MNYEDKTEFEERQTCLEREARMTRMRSTFQGSRF